MGGAINSRRQRPAPPDGNGALLRAISTSGGAAGIIAILAFLASIQGDIANLQAQGESNCQGIAQIGRSVIGVVSVDNELSEPRSADFRASLIRQLRELGNDC